MTSKNPFFPPQPNRAENIRRRNWWKYALDSVAEIVRTSRSFVTQHLVLVTIFVVVFSGPAFLLVMFFAALVFGFDNQ